MPGGKLSYVNRGIAIGLIKAGYTYSRIAIELGCDRTTVSRTHDRYLETGDVKDRPRTGRPKKTTNVDDGVMRASATRKPTITGKLLS